jgi:hypothetical protein
MLTLSSSSLTLQTRFRIVSYTMSVDALGGRAVIG